MPRSDTSVIRKTLKEARRLARTTKCPSRAGLALVRLTGRAGSKIHWDALADAVLAECARFASRQGEVGVWTGEAVENVEAGAPPDLAVRCRWGVVRRVRRQGRGRRRRIRSVAEGHGHARRELKQILEVMQLGLLMADAVLQCGHMMANRDCLLRERTGVLLVKPRAASKERGTDLPGSSVNKEEGLRARMEGKERVEAAEEGLEGIRGMESESDVECIQSPT